MTDKKPEETKEENELKEKELEGVQGGAGSRGRGKTSRLPLQKQ